MATNTAASASLSMRRGVRAAAPRGRSRRHGPISRRSVWLRATSTRHSGDVPHASDRYYIQYVALRKDQRNRGRIGAMLDLLFNGLNRLAPPDTCYVAVFQNDGAEVARFDCSRAVPDAALLRKLNADLSQLSEADFAQEWGLGRRTEPTPTPSETQIDHGIDDALAAGRRPRIETTRQAGSSMLPVDESRRRVRSWTPEGSSRSAGQTR
jgi:hypothetical protein